MHHTKIWGGHGPLAPPFPTPMLISMVEHSLIEPRLYIAAAVQQTC